MLQTERDIKTYENYRAFLQDVFEDLKSQHKRYSYRQFSTDLGFGASNYLHLILSQKRNLSRDGIDKVQNNITWSYKDQRYFQCLVLENQAKDPEEKSRNHEELQKILNKKLTKIIDQEMSYFSHWYIPVIREILTLKNTVSNLNWIAGKIWPNLSADQVKSAITVLERLGFIKKGPKGWEQPQRALTTDEAVTSDTVHNYHHEMLSLSQGALDIPANLRDISALTLSLPLSHFEWLKKRLIDFRTELQHELDGLTDAPETVVQLNMQLFPLVSWKK